MKIVKFLNERRKIFICLIFFFLSLNDSFATTIIASGSPETEDGCGENCSWTLFDDGTFEISGTGAMFDYSVKSGTQTTWVVDNAPWADYIEKIKNLSISSDITSIGKSAFSGATALTTLDVPNNIRSIGRMAFDGAKIQKLILPDTLTNIGAWAFSDNFSLASNIPSSVTTISTGSFYQNKFNHLIIPDSVTEIQNYAFDKSELQFVIMGDQIVSIAENAFGRIEKIYCTGNLEKCKQNVGEIYAPKVQQAEKKQINGVTYYTDKNGNIIAMSGERKNKRIYTVEEATLVSKPTGNTFKIKYK
ncbi:MAG: leucine-rich repeat domain-containing protein [Alphaproteobacteria bacterium]|nr:leucine-rich repeat domain-containing protein [Alphaproteobacteria bacterium]